MTITKQTALNEILIRLADDGSVAGAHVVEIEHLTDTATGQILSSRLLSPRGVTAAEVGPIIGNANAGILEQIDRIKADLAAAQSAKTDAEAARDAALAEKSALEAHIAALTARIEELTATPPPPADPQVAFAAAIQSHIDATAKARGYADGVACASYVASTVPAWADEARLFIAWRDAVWVYAYQQLAAVQTGARPMPEVATIIGELPAIGWVG
jgi:hypothetical protein